MVYRALEKFMDLGNLLLRGASTPIIQNTSYTCTNYMIKKNGLIFFLQNQKVKSMWTNLDPLFGFV